MTIIKVGDKAPEFNATDEAGNPITIGQFKGRKLILFFYPKDDTPGCTAENCNLRDNYADLLARGFAIVGVSPDSAKKHQGFKSKYALPFPLIPDTDQQILKLYGAWGEKQMYGRTYEGVLRTTFVINEEGIVEKIFDKVDTKDHTAQILKVLGLD
ncbi:MAG: thioredoxin-dependent thiol peroxidase [Saprospiraceae bacterium]|jgi:peroxiredoxin Q/BCP